MVWHFDRNQYLELEFLSNLWCKKNLFYINKVLFQVMLTAVCAFNSCGDVGFKENLLKHPIFAKFNLSKKIDQIFTNKHLFKNVDLIFKRAI